MWCKTLLLRAFKRYARRRYDTSLLPVVIILLARVNVIQEHRYWLSWYRSGALLLYATPVAKYTISHHINHAAREKERDFGYGSTCLSFSNILSYNLFCCEIKLKKGSLHILNYSRKKINIQNIQRRNKINVQTSLYIDFRKLSNNYYRLKLKLKQAVLFDTSSNLFTWQNLRRRIWCEGLGNTLWFNTKVLEALQPYFHLIVAALINHAATIT